MYLAGYKPPNVSTKFSFPLEFPHIPKIKSRERQPDYGDYIKKLQCENDLKFTVITLLSGLGYLPETYCITSPSRSQFREYISQLNNALDEMLKVSFTTLPTCFESIIDEELFAISDCCSNFNEKALPNGEITIIGMKSLRIFGTYSPFTANDKIKNNIFADLKKKGFKIKFLIHDGESALIFTKLRYYFRECEEIICQHHCSQSLKKYMDEIDSSLTVPVQNWFSSIVNLCKSADNIYIEYVEQLEKFISGLSSSHPKSQNTKLSAEKAIQISSKLMMYANYISNIHQSIGENTCKSFNNLIYTVFPPFKVNSSSSLLNQTRIKLGLLIFHSGFDNTIQTLFMKLGITFPDYLRNFIMTKQFNYIHLKQKVIRLLDTVSTTTTSSQHAVNTKCNIQLTRNKSPKTTRNIKKRSRKVLGETKEEPPKKLRKMSLSTILN